MYVLRWLTVVVSRGPCSWSTTIATLFPISERNGSILVFNGSSLFASEKILDVMGVLTSVGEVIYDEFLDDLGNA